MVRYLLLISCQGSFQFPSVLGLSSILGKVVCADTHIQLFQGSWELLISHCTVWALGFAGQEKVFPVICPPHPQTTSRAWKIATSSHKHSLFWTGPIVRTANVTAAQRLCVCVCWRNTCVRPCGLAHTQYPFTPPMQKNLGMKFPHLPAPVHSGVDDWAVSCRGKWTHAWGILLRKKVFMRLEIIYYTPLYCIFKILICQQNLFNVQGREHI